MPLAGNVPESLFSLVAGVTVFTLMYGIGLGLVIATLALLEVSQVVIDAGARLRGRRTGSIRHEKDQGQWAQHWISLRAVPVPAQPAPSSLE